MMDGYSVAKLSRLSYACATASGSYARGSALEDLVEYVFSLIPSVKLYDRDIKDESGSQEVDLVFSHFHHISRLPMPDVTIIIECKNEADRTSAAQVREFGNKLRTRSMNSGVLVTSAGVSGNPGKHGHAAIRDELQNGVAIIVVTTSELVRLNKPSDLAALLTARLNEL